MIGILIGSESDREVMLNCSEKLEEFGIVHTMVVASAHREPKKVTKHIQSWEYLGYKIIIAAAGMSAALPGVVASQTKLPVIGVPMKSDLMGIDSLLSIVQMPKGVPVACMSIGKHGAVNAALFAKRILECGHTKTTDDDYIDNNDEPDIDRD